MKSLQNTIYWKVGAIVLGGLLFFSTPTEAATCPLSENTPYKTAASPAVFLVDDRCQKTPMKNPAIYFSYFETWNDIEVVPQSSLEAVPNTPYDFVPWGPKREFLGMSLIKTPRNPKVYLVLNRQKHPIASGDTLTALGLSGSNIEDVSQSVLDSFDTGEALSDQYYWQLDGFAFRDVSDPRVYKMNKGQEAYIESAPQAALLGIRLDRIAVLQRSVDDVVVPEPEEPTSERPSIIEMIMNDLEATPSVQEEEDETITGDMNTITTLPCDTQTVSAGMYDICFGTTLQVNDVTLKPFNLSADRLVMMATYVTDVGFTRNENMDIPVGKRRMVPAFGRDVVGVYVDYIEQLPDGRIKLAVYTRDTNLADLVCIPDVTASAFDGVVCEGNTLRINELQGPITITNVEESFVTFELGNTSYTVREGESVVIDGNTSPVTISVSVGPDVNEGAGVMFSPTGAEQALDEPKQARIHIHAL